MEKLTMAYFGTPSFSAQFLERLITDVSMNQLIETRLVVTQPDRPVGRKHIRTPTAVKTMAIKYRISNIQNDMSKIKDILTSCDLALVYAYGEMIPKDVLDFPRYGFWNVHPSLLPKYRGASPIAYPLILGDAKTGVTLIKMDEKMDHGPIIVQEKYTIQQNEKRSDLEIKLTNLAFEMFKKILLKYAQLFMRSHEKLSFTIKEQGHTKATHTRTLKKEDGFITLATLRKALNNKSLDAAEWPDIMRDYYSKNSQTTFSRSIKSRSSQEIIFNCFRGLYPWPGIWTLVRIGGQDKRLKITDLKLGTSKQGNKVTSKLIIRKVQLEGKKEIDFETFKRAYDNIF